MLGKLSWAAIPLSEPIPMVASGVVALTILGVLVWITVKGWLPYLWKEWITSVDHKRIGVMYVLLAMVMLLRGFSDAIMMRSQQALAYKSPGFLPPEHYNQVFSAHGTLMIFFVAMPFMIGLMNLVVPLQLGKVVEVIGVVLVPVVIGMVVNSKAPGFSQRMEKPMKVFSAVVLAAFTLIAIAKEWDALLTSFTSIGPDTRPSRPTATARSPAANAALPNARPRCSAKSASMSRPTTPRMS